jgi:hypothetical protein
MLPPAAPRRGHSNCPSLKDECTILTICSLIAGIGLTFILPAYFLFLVPYQSLEANWQSQHESFLGPARCLAATTPCSFNATYPYALDGGILWDNTSYVYSTATVDCATETCLQQQQDAFSIQVSGVTVCFDGRDPQGSMTQDCTVKNGDQGTAIILFVFGSFFELPLALVLGLYYPITLICNTCYK